MLNRIAPALALIAAVAVTAMRPAPQTPDQGLTVHEWGTFTTVAGEDGRASEWLPLGGPTDLPCFVEHYKNQQFKVLLTDKPVELDYEAARAGLTGKVRMETPVLYFYAPRETTVRVHVKFPRGVMTEWYPKATVTQANVGPATLRSPTSVSTIDWPEVIVQPTATPAFPTGSGESHYYAARQTDAAPLFVGGQQEKFLFYRGVAGFDVPISAEALGDGGVRIRNLGANAIPNVVLFANYDGRIGFRVVSALRGEVTLEAPPLTSDFKALRPELEHMLTSAGLYEKEAKAMVETWRDSWFEEGTRVFYILPQTAVDSILPLTIYPAPARIARAFVGRMEVMTPMTANAVEKAVARNDAVALERFGRFLGPIADRFMTKPAQGPRVKEVTNAALASYVARAAVCQ